MSIRLVNAVTDHGMTPPQKAVLIVLALYADETGGCWPAVDSMCRKTSLGERTVRRALADLQQEGWIVAVPVPGRTNRYQLNVKKIMADPCQSGRGARAAGVPERQGGVPERQDTPAAAAPESSLNRQEPSEQNSEGARARKTKLPDGWEPAPFADDSKCAIAVASWSEDELATHVEHFIAYHTANESRFACWQAAWRTWVLRTRKPRGQNGTANRNTAGQDRPRQPDRRDGFHRAIDRSLGFDPVTGEVARQPAGAREGDFPGPPARLRIV